MLHSDTNSDAGCPELWAALPVFPDPSVAHAAPGRAHMGELILASSHGLTAPTHHIISRPRRHFYPVLPIFSSLNLGRSERENSAWCNWLYKRVYIVYPQTCYSFIACENINWSEMNGSGCLSNISYREHVLCYWLGLGLSRIHVAGGQHRLRVWWWSMMMMIIADASVTRCHDPWHVTPGVWPRSVYCTNVVNSETNLSDPGIIAANHPE